MTSRDYLFSLEHFGIKLGLEQIRALLRGLDRPDLAYPTIVIAGTNGKGSVTAFVERALRAAGHRTGRYTSPHLVDIEERVAIDGQPIDPRVFDDLADEVRRAAGALAAPPTFFEATTALALQAFRHAKVDIAVCEVGLGGRLDATNVLSPVCVAITAVDLDHEAHLGSTLDAIAREKAGIIKPDGLCVLARNPAPVRDVVAAACEAARATLVYAPDEAHAEVSLAGGHTHLSIRTRGHDYGQMTLGLRGRHQADNAIAAVGVLERVTARAGVAVSADAIATGLREAVWPGRLEIRAHGGGHVIIDGAHNPAGARALADFLAETCGRPLPIVLGVMRDKAIGGIVDALAARAAIFLCTAPSSSRAATPAELAAVVRERAPGIPAVEVPAPADAIAAALTHDAMVVAAGSLYLAGEIRAELS